MKRRRLESWMTPAWSMASTKCAARAVHDRHFRAVDLDKHVVDAKAGERGEKMFDGGDRGVGGVSDHGAEFSHADLRPVGPDGPVPSVWQTRAQEDDAAVGLGRMKNDLHGSIGVNAGSGERRAGSQGRLFGRNHAQLTLCVERGRSRQSTGGPLFDAAPHRSAPEWPAGPDRYAPDAVESVFGDCRSTRNHGGQNTPAFCHDKITVSYFSVTLWPDW